MIVLDTNVLSEIMKPAGDRSLMVFDWLDALAPEKVFTTSISVAEIGVGLHRLPAGKRREAMAISADRVFSHILAERILPFDVKAAERYAPLMALRRRAGLHHDHTLDLQIASIADSLGFAVATRDVGDFAGLGVELINPWDSPSA